MSLLCRNNYELCSMMVMDEYGRGQFVQHSIIDSNSEWHFEKLLSYFQAMNPRWQEVRVVVVDKDLKEINVIRRLLPNARVLLCQFHVKKWLSDVVNKNQYVTYTMEQKQHLNHAVHHMTYAD